MIGAGLGIEGLKNNKNKHPSELQKKIRINIIRNQK